jgi:DNA-binding NtrC family response regulator
MATILVVDDEKNIRDVLDEGLTDAGYKVESASTGESAQELVDSRPFDLMITDVIMPGTDGLELIQYVKKIRPEMKIIAISAGGRLHVTSMYLHSAKALGADLQIDKPFDMSNIITDVKNLLES